MVAIMPTVTPVLRRGVACDAEQLFHRGDLRRAQEQAATARLVFSDGAGALRAGKQLLCDAPLNLLQRQAKGNGYVHRFAGGVGIPPRNRVLAGNQEKGNRRSRYPAAQVTRRPG
jgi:hypothetical protein